MCALEKYIIRMAFEAPQVVFDFNVFNTSIIKTAITFLLAAFWVKNGK